MRSGLDPVIHQPVRLRIVVALHRNREASFTQLRDGLGLTDGNLATHTARLVEAGYVEGPRRLVGLSFEVRYRLTPRGAQAFAAYLAALAALLGEPGLGAAVTTASAPPEPARSRPRRGDAAPPP